MHTSKRLKAKDRELDIDCVLQENSFAVCIKPIGEDDHLIRLMFTRGFAEELREFLNESL